MRRFEPGDRAAIETPRGTIRAGEIVDHWIGDYNRRPVPFVTVQLSPGVCYTVPEAQAAEP